MPAPCLEQESASLSPLHASDENQIEPVEETLRGILTGNLLTPRFQPILEMQGGVIHGFEGLIRGPSDNMLHSPVNLFQVANRCGLLPQLESSCIRTLAEAYAREARNARLFLNVSPRGLVRAFEDPRLQIPDFAEFGLSPRQIVIELTESEPTFEWEPLLRAAEHFRALGFAIALDDLGEGFASLKMWSALRPDYVKIDKYFVQGVSFDPVKHQFLRSIRELAMRMGATTVAEGIETEADLAALLELGLDLGQGYFLGRPAPVPVMVPPPFLLLDDRIREQKKAVWGRSRVTAAKLMDPVPPVASTASNQDVLRRFSADPLLLLLPVVHDGRPVGVLHRNRFIEMLAKPYRNELFAKRPCSNFMDREILIVDHQTALHELSQRIAESDLRTLMQGMVITRNGRYIGMASGQSLMREITDWQVNAARYANPLTLLPGNVPIQEHLEAMLEQGTSFVIAYADLDHFKPYNDVYGYRKGDDIIQWTGHLLMRTCDPSMDFLGHVGGDDFILILRTKDWQDRLESVLDGFTQGRSVFFSGKDLERGGYETEDRTGQIVFHPLVTISIGALKVTPELFASHHEVNAALSSAKKMAKKMEGNSLFVERRMMSS
jgi:EAL domain-containing protein (putative c-di-GMP-specific phosphodiesterase class I)/GGDEF domain-containing protein